MHTPSTGFSRHITRTNNAVLPGGRTALFVDGAVIGWVLPDLAAALAGFAAIRVQPHGLILTDGGALFDISKDLSARGFHRWRGEIFDVRAVPGGAVLAQIDRGGLPVFGIAAEGVHVNGLVARADGLHVWVGRRAATKALDPGKLDHIVAGGMSAGFGAMATLVKEAAEEAAIPADLARRAVAVGTIAYAMERPEGLRRDRLYCYDLMLPDSFTPRPNDGEVAGFELWPIARAMAVVRDSDNFKFNVNVVMIDLLLRTGAIAGAEAEALRLEMAEISFPAVPR